MKLTRATITLSIMSEDYFDDTSDADFLALARQLESRGEGPSTGNTSSIGSNPQSTVPKPTTPSTTSGARNAETNRPDTSKTAPRVLRPGFNAVIVNTRQVSLFDKRS